MCVGYAHYRTEIVKLFWCLLLWANTMIQSIDFELCEFDVQPFAAFSGGINLQ